MHIVLVGRPEGKRPLGRPRRRWEDNIKMDLREVGYDDREWIDLAQDRDQWRAYVRGAMNLRERRIVLPLTSSSEMYCLIIDVRTYQPELQSETEILTRKLNETVSNVLGQCPKGELVINARHHRVRHALATSLKTLNWEIHEEVHCISSDGSFRRADIIAINGHLKRALVLDPTIRFERNLNQATEVDIEKKSIYEPCLPYLSQKYNVPLKQWSVIGLLFGSRGSITKFTWNYLKELHIPFDYVMCGYNFWAHRCPFSYLNVVNNGSNLEQYRKRPHPLVPADQAVAMRNTSLDGRDLLGSNAASIAL
ncbi:hypothetical protein ANN_20799 [Periplaneta americana]|uniref:Uncharacterized protein n=1 Tax=Periplaneta americana TaxID=6978 RepID=A0ABQ8SDW9_PERAM|nr:hypothetical protein ANN_20799 [Periplaneta americana]